MDIKISHTENVNYLLWNLDITVCKGQGTCKISLLWQGFVKLRFLGKEK